MNECLRPARSTPSSSGCSHLPPVRRCFLQNSTNLASNFTTPIIEGWRTSQRMVLLVEKSTSVAFVLKHRGERRHNVFTKVKVIGHPMKRGHVVPFSSRLAVLVESGIRRVPDHRPPAEVGLNVIRVTRKGTSSTESN